MSSNRKKIGYMFLFCFYAMGFSFLGHCGSWLALCPNAAHFFGCLVIIFFMLTCWSAILYFFKKQEEKEEIKIGSLD